MSRRHLFDNGFPVASRTLVLGSTVLLAVARQAQRTSRFRLATSLLRLADSSRRLTTSLLRENYARLLSHAQAQAAHARGKVETGAGGEP